MPLTASRNPKPEQDGCRSDDDRVPSFVEERSDETTEIADYSKRSFENSTKAMQSLIAVKSPEKAIEVQTDYVRAAYEDFTGGKILITEQEPLTDGTSGRHPHLVCNSPPRGAYECPRR